MNAGTFITLTVVGLVVLRFIVGPLCYAIVMGAGRLARRVLTFQPKHRSVPTVSEWHHDMALAGGPSKQIQRDVPQRQPISKPQVQPSNDARLQRELLESSVKAEPQFDLIPFDQMWARLVGATHVLLTGETNSGKSTAANALLSARAETDLICVIDPHAKPTDWAGITAIGKGRNYGMVQYALDVLLKEMTTRYDRRANGDEEYPPVTIFIDELPSIMKECPNAKDVIGPFLREARKVEMRVVLMTQSTRVKTLGIEGEGDVLENLVWLMLGEKATEACKDAAKLERPAAFEDKGVTKPVIVNALPGLACKVFSPDNLWEIDCSEDALARYEVTQVQKDVKGGKWTEQHVKVAAAITDNPDISTRALARVIYPNSTGGGDYSAKAKAIREQVEQVLGVPLEV